MSGRRRGFTLPEVLATLVLIGVVLPVVMQGISLSMKLASDARHRAQAAVLAEMKLNELAYSEGTTAVAGSGDFGAEWPEYTWRAATGGVDDGMVELVVEVTWRTRDTPRELVVTTWIRPGTGGMRL